MACNSFLVYYIFFDSFLSYKAILFFSGEHLTSSLVTWESSKGNLAVFSQVSKAERKENYGNHAPHRHF